MLNCQGNKEVVNSEHEEISSHEHCGTTIEENASSLIQGARRGNHIESFPLGGFWG